MMPCLVAYTPLPTCSPDQPWINVIDCLKLVESDSDVYIYIHVVLTPLLQVISLL